MIKKIDATIFCVKNLARASAFYRDTLGLKTEMEVPGFYHEFNIGNTWLGLYQNPEGKTGGTAVVLLNVDKLETAMDALKKKGVQFNRKIIDSPVCRMALFSDPDGNSLCLHEHKPAHH